MKKGSVIAVSKQDFEKFGCTECGEHQGFDSPISYAPGHHGPNGEWICKLHTCAACKSRTIILNGIDRSIVLVGDNYPTVQKHPRDDSKS